MPKLRKAVNKQELPDYKYELKKLIQDLNEHDREIEKLRQEIKDKRLSFPYIDYPCYLPLQKTRSENHIPRQKYF